MMRNGRAVDLENPQVGLAKQERVVLIGTRSADHIRASGHAPRIQAGHMTCTRPQAARQISLAMQASSTHDPLEGGMASGLAARARDGRHMDAAGIGQPSEAGEPVSMDGCARRDDTLGKRAYPLSSEKPYRARIW